MNAPFHSILFPIADAEGGPPPEDTPDVLRDLQLDQVIERATGWDRAVDLKTLFHLPLTDPDAIAYRQEVFRDLERAEAEEAVAAFTDAMHAMRGELGLAGKAHFRYERERWFLSGVQRYCGAAGRLAKSLSALDLRSRGLRAFRDLLDAYTESHAFRALSQESRALAADLASIRYVVRIRSGSVTVGKWQGEADYSDVIAELFSRFTAGLLPDEGTRPPAPGALDYVQARVVERVALLHPEIFRALEGFPARHEGFVDHTIARFDREIRFYLAYRRLTARLREEGLRFCHPRLDRSPRAIETHDSFDLALALKLSAEGRRVVPNGFRLDDPERVLVVTGPNHGGKTTFARMFGQLHWLARLGCPVPGTQARLALCDRVFTHFERAEEVRTGRGRLHDDLMRIRRILDEATGDSVVVINEIFSSTTLKDAVFLGGRIMEEVTGRDTLAVLVTFLDELTAFNEKTVSMVAGVDPEDPSVRTFRVDRRAANGLAYALSVAEKHRVTYDWLVRRIAS